jgi:hypothetical protein
MKLRQEREREREKESDRETGEGSEQLKQEKGTPLTRKPGWGQVQRVA